MDELEDFEYNITRYRIVDTGWDPEEEEAYAKESSG